jgi:hypothetical protein
MTQRNQVTDLLEQLHGTLASASALSEHDRELLKRLAADISAILAQPAGASVARNTPLSARLSEAVTRFEVSHPDLTTVLAGVSKSLVDLGL